MALMRFVQVSLHLEPITKPAAPKEMQGDLVLHVVKTDAGFTLFGQTSEYMLEVPNFKEHAGYQRKSEAVRWQAELSPEEMQTLNTLLQKLSPCLS